MCNHVFKMCSQLCFCMLFLLHFHSIIVKSQTSDFEELYAKYSDDSKVPYKSVHSLLDHLQIGSISRNCLEAKYFKNGPSNLSKAEFGEFLHSILYSIDAHGCANLTVQEHKHTESASLGISYKVWLACLGAVCLVSLSGLIVVALVPIMSHSFYNAVTQYLIALSVGSLTGDAFLHLIPHALFPHSHDHEHEPHAHSHDHHSPTWPVFERLGQEKKAVIYGLVIVLGIYAFFLTERITILWQNRNSRKKMKRKFQNELSPCRGNRGSVINTPSDRTFCRFDDCIEHGRVISDTVDEDKHQTTLSTSTANAWVMRHGHSHDAKDPNLVHHHHGHHFHRGRQDGSDQQGMRSHVGGVDTAPPTNAAHCLHHHQQRGAARQKPFSLHTIWQKLSMKKSPPPELDGAKSREAEQLPLREDVQQDPSNENHYAGDNVDDTPVGYQSSKSAKRASSLISPASAVNNTNNEEKKEAEEKPGEELNKCTLSHSNNALHRDCCITESEVVCSCDECAVKKAGEESMEGGPLTMADTATQIKPDRGHFGHTHCYSMAKYVSPLRDKPHGHHHGHSHDLSNVRSIAYTIIAGDGLHNFCDGIAIGAAFARDMSSGISTFIAVLCHELPHELGDFAVLLNAGMSVKTALFYNFLTVLFCFVGMVIGVWLGSIQWVSSWLFMLTAGMFIYIALVDMVPELATQRLKGLWAIHSPLALFLFQNAGIVSGLAIMFLIAWFEEQI